MKSLLIFLLSVIILSGCKSKFDKNEPLGKKNFTLISQDSILVNFPRDFNGKPMLLGFIFTNCPDVCPMTSHNFQMVQEETRSKGIKDVNFVLISFDPERDRPWVLNEYASVRDIDKSNFKLLTGTREDINALMKKMQVIAIPGDTTKTSEGDLIYFFTHTDRAFLIDKDNKIRTEYRASKLNVAEVVEDIRSLE
jgi:protein SCO1/2